MPVLPSTWATNSPITAHQLNQDLYTYDGSFFGANGTFFHSNRPMLVESYTLNGVIVVSPPGGEFIVLGGNQGFAIRILDNSALFGSGSDFPGTAATFQSGGATAPGSNGIPGQPGGWSLFSAFIPLSSYSGLNNIYGVGWIINASGSPLPDMGCLCQGSTARSNCGFAVDLIQRQFQPAITSSGSAITITPNDLYQPVVYTQDPGGISKTAIANSASTCGQTPRFMELWMGVSNGNGNNVASIPSPLSTITTSTTLSSATLNTTIQNTFNLLNYPPMLNAQIGGALGSPGTILSNTITVVPFTVTPVIDSYSGYSTASTQYVVPLTGWYFCHATILYGQNWNTGVAKAGFQVNGTNYWGGSYNATTPGNQNSGASVTKLLDLQAGDTVKTVTLTSTASSFGAPNVSHVIMSWMCPVNTGTQSWVPPDVTGFQFQAATSPGTAATQLGGIMNSKICNDINFLLNRPYLSVHQTTVQTALSSNTWSSITMQSTVGLVHGSLGDNYNGWNSATNRYVAPVNGWYMAVAEYNAATTSTANSGNSLVAGFSVPTSGGVTCPTTDNNGHAGQPDWYQQLMVSNTGTYPTGVTAIGMYYLLAGETIQPCAMYQQASGTWGTDVTSRTGVFNSHFNLIWMSN